MASDAAFYWELSERDHCFAFWRLRRRRLRPPRRFSPAAALPPSPAPRVAARSPARRHSTRARHAYKSNGRRDVSDGVASLVDSCSVPGLLEARKWDSVRAILITPPLSDCGARTRGRCCATAAALGDSGGDELAALEAREDAMSHLVIWPRRKSNPVEYRQIDGRGGWRV